MQEIKPISIPGIHSRFLKFFKRKFSDKGIQVLDVGAGHGAFSKDLHEAGYNVHACDLFPEHFYYKPVDCRKTDLLKPFPYESNTFDVAASMEVTEHILDHENFFSEINRILKPGGQLLISTPNILSLKSRWRFFWSGFFYTFSPLELKNYNGLQHVASLTLDQYNYLGIKSGFEPVKVHVDKFQSTSRVMMVLYPFLWLHGKLRKIKPVHNTTELLLGRILFLVYEKPK